MDPKPSLGFNIQHLVEVMIPKMRFLHMAPSQASPGHGVEGTRGHHPSIALVQWDVFGRKGLTQPAPTGNWDQNQHQTFHCSAVVAATEQKGISAVLIAHGKSPTGPQPWKTWKI